MMTTETPVVVAEDVEHKIASSWTQLGAKEDGWVYNIHAICACGEEIVHTVVGGDTAPMTERALRDKLGAHVKERKDAMREAKEVAKKASTPVAAALEAINGASEQGA